MSATLTKSALGFVAGILALTPLASATLYTFQDGLNGYDGTQDAALYAGDPNAGGPGIGVNTGANPTLLARGDHRSILFFDLSSLAGQTATSDATLTLTMADNHAGVAFSIYAISDANAGWLQGDNTSYAPAGPGEVTYEDLSSPSTPWTGGDGLEGAGGYNHTAVDSGVGGLYNTTVNLTIPQSLIQHWIDGPNAGLLINSDTMYVQIQFRSSEDTAGRPMLQINAVPEPGTLSALGVMASAWLLSRRRK
ncbi:MAG: PEP-CTERM sorting domain-containing protein [Phycisphaerales bacterium]|nr:PEP-CTERM sorting domain-containing protein [Phycisphaerales bacterium]